jgi:hypothetical protein
VDGQRDTSPPSALFSYSLKRNIYKCTRPLLAADIPRAPVTNWEAQCVTLAGCCYAVGHGMKVQLVTPYRVSLATLRRYGTR